MRGHVALRVGRTAGVVVGDMATSIAVRMSSPCVPSSTLSLSGPTSGLLLLVPPLGALASAACTSGEVAPEAEASRARVGRTEGESELLSDWERKLRGDGRGEMIVGR